jgi:hypothetical protein
MDKVWLFVNTVTEGATSLSTWLTVEFSIMNPCLSDYWSRHLSNSGFSLLQLFIFIKENM